LHWNGKHWRQRQIGLPSNGQFSAVAASSSRNAWAVGYAGLAASPSPLIEHWNGEYWRQVQSPALDGLGVLSGVTVTPLGNAWAVGSSLASGEQSLILYWNGTQWLQQPSPNPTGQTNLWGVSATSASNAWAVGYTNPDTCGNGGPKCATAAFYWNGSTWQVTATPNPPSQYLNAFLGVVALYSGGAWAVGTTDWSSTLIARWKGTAWH
jgi:hypothetical protein